MCVFFPDVDGSKFHVLVQSTKYFLPIALCLPISISVETQGVEHFGLIFLADLFKQEIGTSDVDIMLATPLEENEVAIKRFPEISLSHMHNNTLKLQFLHGLSFYNTFRSFHFRVTSKH